MRLRMNQSANSVAAGDVSATTGVDVPDGDMPVTVAGMQAAVAADEAAAPHASEVHVCISAHTIRVY